MFWMNIKLNVKSLSTWTLNNFSCMKVKHFHAAFIKTSLIYAIFYNDHGYIQANDDCLEAILNIMSQT